MTKKDILAFIESGAHRQAPAAAPAPASTASAAPVASTQAGAMNIPMQPVKTWARDRVEPMNAMRRTISDRMVESKQYSAHVHTCFEVDYSRVDGLRKKFKAQYADRGAKLTFTTFLARAVISALEKHPIINSAHDGENVVYRGDINLGIAVALDNGLLVPVVKDADDLSMVGLSRKLPIWGLGHEPRS